MDEAELKSKYIELQKQAHPDNFASESETVQRLAVQKVSYLNQAFECLKSPLERAIYLLNIAGHPFDPDTQIHSDVEFLMAQMELREALSEVTGADDPFTALDRLLVEASEQNKQYQMDFKTEYEQSNWSQAAVAVNKMMFATKLLHEISEKEESLF